MVDADIGAVVDLRRYRVMYFSSFTSPTTTFLSLLALRRHSLKDERIESEAYISISIRNREKQ